MSKQYPDHYIRPDWPAPSNIRAISTTRKCGCSVKPFDSFNMAKHVEDSGDSVIRNRHQLFQDVNLPVEPYWLEQLHTTDLVNIDQPVTPQSIPQADGCYSSQSGQVCVVMTADCLPILMCDKQGRWVAAVHAGWRGLVNGIIQNTINQYSESSSNLIAWLGPAIGKKYFEVGDDVRTIFTDKNSSFIKYFIEQPNNKLLCDLYGIARSILSDYSINSYGGEYCTYEDKENFFSYRRDGKTGRMASLIWIESRVNK